MKTRKRINSRNPCKHCAIAFAFSRICQFLGLTEARTNQILDHVLFAGGPIYLETRGEELLLQMLKPDARKLSPAEEAAYFAQGGKL